jgi:hypothetical protein
MVIDKSNTQRLSSDATQTQIGFDYQKLIALECVLNGKNNDIVGLECYGDVNTSNMSIETKCHSSKHTLGDQSPDFWKTLKNYVIDREKYKQFTKLILHTTSTIPQGGIFNEWNNLSGIDKFNILEKIRNTPTDSIKGYVKIIYMFDDSYGKSDLIQILGKFLILSNQKRYQEKYEEILNNPIFEIVKNLESRRCLIRTLFGKISLKPFESSTQWSFTRSDFMTDLYYQMRLYLQEDLKFPQISEDSGGLEGNSPLQLIEELKAIELNTEVEQAVINYLKTEKCSLELIRMGAQTVEEAIEIFENELYTKMNITKRRFKNLMSPLDFYPPEQFKRSRDLYYTCMDFQKLKIRGVQEIQYYFQYGKMHKIVNEQKFKWKIT